MFVQANVIVEVEEVKRPFSGDLGVFSKPEVFVDIIFHDAIGCMLPALVLSPHVRPC